MELNALAYLAVFVGGGGGSVLRFAMSKAIVANEWLQGHWATLLINVLASIVLVVIVDAYDDKSKLMSGSFEKFRNGAKGIATVCPRLGY